MDVVLVLRAIGLFCVAVFMVSVFASTMVASDYDDKYDEDCDDE